MYQDEGQRDKGTEEQGARKRGSKRAKRDDARTKKVAEFIFATRRNIFAQLLFEQDMNGALEGSKKQAFHRAKPSGPKNARRAGRNGGVMVSMKKMMLGAALAAGTLAVTAIPAHAAEVHFGVYVGAPAAAYVPPSPGPGYVWVDGYWDNGYWVNGYWNYVGDGPAYGGVVYSAPVYGYGRGYYRDRDDEWREHERREHEWREHEWREHEWREHDRGWHGDHFDHDRR